MRHLKSGRKLGRTRSHRRATLSALSVSLISHKKIRTTVAKAKEARMVVEKLVTRAKRTLVREGDGKLKDVYARRKVYSFLRDRKAVSTLFGEIAPKVINRPGGYTRVVKIGQRRGDGAPMALIEFVDYNTGQAKKSPKPTRKASKSMHQKGTPSEAATGAPEARADASADENTDVQSKQPKPPESDTKKKKKQKKSGK